MSGEKFMKWVSFGIGAYVAAVFIFMAAVKMDYPYAIGLGEPPMAQTIARSMEGHNPYKDLNEPPYSLVPYGPVFITLSSWVNGIFEGPFGAGRAICLLATLGTAAFIFLTLSHSGLGRVESALPAFLFLSHSFIAIWGVQVNVDMLGVFWAMAAFHCFQRFERSGFTGVRWFAAGTVAVTLAFFTKQSMIASGAAFFVFLLIRKQKAWAVRYFVAQGCALALVFAALVAGTDGWYFTHVMEIGKRFFFHQFIYRFWWEAWKAGPALVLISAVALVYWPLKRRLSLVFLYLLFTVLLTVSLGKQGSDTNYFLEWIAVTSLAVGFVWIDARPQLKMALLLFVFAQLVMGAEAFANPGAIRREYAEKKDFFDRVSTVIRRVDGRVLSEDMGLLIANGKEIYYEPFPMGQMAYSGVWDNRPILEALNRKEFKLAVMLFYAPKLRANRCFPENFMKAFNANYEYKTHVKLPWTGDSPVSYFFYEPKKS